MLDTAGQAGLHGEMPGATEPSDPTADAPAPQAGRSTGTAVRLLDLVRALIVIGQELVEGFKDGAGGFTPDQLRVRFDTGRIALIVARVRRALLIAARLETRLVRYGHRLDAPWPAPGQATATQPRPAARPGQPGARAERFDAAADDAALLAGLPSADEIARRMRRQPVGAVLVDLCLDLGINTTHPLWRPLNEAIIRHGGSLARLLQVRFQRGTSRWAAPECASQEQADPALEAAGLAPPDQPSMPDAREAQVVAAPPAHPAASTVTAPPCQGPRPLIPPPREPPPPTPPPLALPPGVPRPDWFQPPGTGLLPPILRNL